jgi:hypothetical protein
MHAMDIARVAIEQQQQQQQQQTCVAGEVAGGGAHMQRWAA